jgi:hypothetical protein
VNATARAARLVAGAAELDDAIADRHSDWLYVRFVPAGGDVRRAQEAGKRLFIAGALVAGREPANWQAASRNGIDAILTDYPLDLRRELTGRP